MSHNQKDIHNASPGGLHHLFTECHYIFSKYKDLPADSGSQVGLDLFTWIG
jgi:hypothetical protein